MDNVAEQVVKDCSDYLESQDKAPLPITAVGPLKSQLKEIKSPEQRIRRLIGKQFIFISFVQCKSYFLLLFLALRAEEFIGSLINASSPRPVQVPVGLSLLQEELALICGSLMRLAAHNKAVFGEYYQQIILTHLKGEQTVQDLSSGERPLFK